MEMGGPQVGEITRLGEVTRLSIYVRDYSALIDFRLIFCDK